MTNLIVPSPRSKTSAVPIDHKWGILKIDGSGGVPGYSGTGGFFAAYETVIYDTYLTDWTPGAMAEADFQVLSNFCTNQATSSPFPAIVTQEFDGCSMVSLQANAGVNATAWKVDAIAKTGQKFGTPNSFFADTPTADPVPSSKCDNDRVAIRVQVMGFGAFCKEVVAPEQIARLTRGAQSATQKVQEITDQLKKEQAAKNAAVAEKDSAQAQLKDTKTTDQTRIDQLTNTIEEKDKQIAKRDEQITKLTNSLSDLTAVLRTALGQIESAGKTSATPSVPSPPP